MSEQIITEESERDVEAEYLQSHQASCLIWLSENIEDTRTDIESTGQSVRDRDDSEIEDDGTYNLGVIVKNYRYRPGKNSQQNSQESTNNQGESVTYPFPLLDSVDLPGTEILTGKGAHNRG